MVWEQFETQWTQFGSITCVAEAERCCEERCTPSTTCRPWPSWWSDEAPGDLEAEPIAAASNQWFLHSAGKMVIPSKESRWNHTPTSSSRRRSVCGAADGIVSCEIREKQGDEVLKWSWDGDGTQSQCITFEEPIWLRNSDLLRGEGEGSCEWGDHGWRHYGEGLLQWWASRLSTTQSGTTFRTRTSAHLDPDWQQHALWGSSKSPANPVCRGDQWCRRRSKAESLVGRSWMGMARRWRHGTQGVQPGRLVDCGGRGGLLGRRPVPLRLWRLGWRQWNSWILVWRLVEWWQSPWRVSVERGQQRSWLYSWERALWRSVHPGSRGSQDFEGSQSRCCQSSCGQRILRHQHERSRERFQRQRKERWKESSMREVWKQSTQLPLLPGQVLESIGKPKWISYEWAWRKIERKVQRQEQVQERQGQGALQRVLCGRREVPGHCERGVLAGVYLRDVAALGSEPDDTGGSPNHRGHGCNGISLWRQCYGKNLGHDAWSSMPCFSVRPPKFQVWQWIGSTSNIEGWLAHQVFGEGKLLHPWRRCGEHSSSTWWPRTMGAKGCGSLLWILLCSSSPRWNMADEPPQGFIFTLFLFSWLVFPFCFWWFCVSTLIQPTSQTRFAHDIQVFCIIRDTPLAIIPLTHIVVFFICSLIRMGRAIFLRKMGIFCKHCFNWGAGRRNKSRRPNNPEKNDTTKDLPGHLSSLVNKVEKEIPFFMACSCLGGCNNVSNLKGYIFTRSAIVSMYRPCTVSNIERRRLLALKKT